MDNMYSSFKDREILARLNLFDHSSESLVSVASGNQIEVLVQNLQETSFLRGNVLHLTACQDRVLIRPFLVHRVIYHIFLALLTALLSLYLQHERLFLKAVLILKHVLPLVSYETSKCTVHDLIHLATHTHPPLPSSSLECK